MINNSKKHTFLREIEIKYKYKKVSDEKIGNRIFKMGTVVQLFSDLQNETKEKLIGVNLDVKNKIICFEVIAIGSVKSIYSRPMEVVRTSILVNADGIILLHNHPSGDPEPSSDDIKFTQDLKDLTKIMGFKFHDHLIIGIELYYSFTYNDYFKIKK